MVRATTDPIDYVALILLLIIILTGVAPTLVDLVGPGYDYRTTVAPWFRGLFPVQPEATTVATAPLIYQIHVISAWVIWAVWPFSRLMHAWGYPLWYLWRPYVVYGAGMRNPRQSPVPVAGSARSAPRTDRTPPMTSAK